MKTILIFIVSAATIYAGSICFDIPSGAPTQRVAAAFGDMLHTVDANGSPRPANQQEVTQATQAWVQSTTQDYERRQNMAQFVPSPVPISASPNPGSPTPTPGLAAATKSTPEKK